MLTLAPLLYRGIFAERGGPIAEVETSRVPVFDRSSFEATAYLKRDLGGKRDDRGAAGTMDGMGSSENAAEAQNIAISEALERWAFRETLQSGSAAKYGFDHDRTSIGMAAFPGFKWQARRRARLEALERFAVVGWWDRQIPATVHRSPYPDVGMVRIRHNQTFGEVVLLYHQAPTGFVAYGHAAGSTLATATSRAAVRLVQSQYRIARHRARGGITPRIDRYEQRCLHYSGAEGHAEFQERLKTGEQGRAPAWKPIFDGEIPGRWSHWTTVWRYCVEMPTYDFLDTRRRFFFW